MDYHLNIIGRDGEQVHGLDELKPLVHHCCAVDGYLRAHAPVGVLHGLFGSDVLKLAPCLAAERAAGAGEEDLLELAFLPAHEALEDGRVLGVDRNDLCALFLCARHDDIARADESLFIRKGDALFRVYGGESRTEPDGTGHGGHDAVGAVHAGGFDKPVHAGADADIGVRDGNFELLCRRLVIDSDELGMQAARLLFEHVNFSVRRKRRNGHADMLGNGDGLSAYRAGAAKDRNGLYHSIFLFF